MLAKNWSTHLFHEITEPLKKKEKKKYFYQCVLICNLFVQVFNRTQIGFKYPLNLTHTLQIQSIISILLPSAVTCLHSSACYICSSHACGNWLLTMKDLLTLKSVVCAMCVPSSVGQLYWLHQFNSQSSLQLSIISILL